MAAELFPDTPYAIALSSATDQHHDEAIRLAARIEADDRRLVTTRAVLVEIGNVLSKLRYRASAVALLYALENDRGSRSSRSRRNCMGEA